MCGRGPFAALIDLEVTMFTLLARLAGLFTEPVRARIYLTLSAAGPLLVVYGVASSTRAALWLALASQVLGNGLAVINARNARQWLYGIALAAAGLAVAYGLTSEAEAALWVGVVAAALGVAGTSVAAAYTPPRTV